MAETARRGGGQPRDSLRTDRYVLTVDLKDDADGIEAYRRHHADVWPDVVQSLQDAGVVALDIHLLGRRLVMVVELQEGLDLRETFARHASSTPRVAEWERLMATYQQAPPDARPGERWALMEPICRLPAEAAPRVGPPHAG